MTTAVPSMRAKAQHLATRLRGARAELRANLAAMVGRQGGRGTWLCPVCLAPTKAACTGRPPVADLRHRAWCKVTGWIEMAEDPA